MDLDWHHVHNLDLLATSHEHKGQMRTAESLLREANAVKPLTEYQEFNQKSLTVFLLGRQRWREALAAAKKMTAAKGAATRTVGHAFAGHAYLGMRATDRAHASLAAAERELASRARAHHRRRPESWGSAAVRGRAARRDAVTRRENAGRPGTAQERAKSAARFAGPRCVDSSALSSRSFREDGA